MKLLEGRFFNSFAGRFLTGSVLVTVQALILGISVVKGIGLVPADMAGFYLGIIFISIVFFAVMYGISNTIGILGAPVMFVVLILQLASSGGTFPIETAPGFYRVISRFIPMTYSVDLLRQLVAGINSAVLNRNIIALGVFLAVFLGGSILVRAGIDFVKNKLKSVSCCTQP